ncbi:unnamed protein product, partial [Echinostoma caproni]|uniref:Uncharacterized protein n=1 Tax=Echinostoma caproni TaxID=27848 RepID=A0A183B6S3_9TREM
MSPPKTYVDTAKANADPTIRGCSGSSKAKTAAISTVPHVVRAPLAKALKVGATGKGSSKPNGVKKNILYELEDQIKEISERLRSLKATEGGQTVVHKTLLILSNEDPLAKETKARREMDRRMVLDILRIAGMERCKLKSFHGVSISGEGTKNGQPRAARPLLVEFSDQSSRNLLLANSGRIFNVTRGSSAGCPLSEHTIEGILDARLAVSIFSPYSGGKRNTSKKNKGKQSISVKPTKSVEIKLKTKGEQAAKKEDKESGVIAALIS